uniref:Uncharacterized protein n=2 Tax=Oryza sativa subsp. japonica TaxID=39947 RepID=A0A5S6R6G5_ORYSJ|nr:Unknown protein [Oryza sativa Japonica Group]AAP53502.1 retrotransposon protein, putative, Ty3-gypsy subclass [Oryza sativa Japonica Group]
MSWHRAGVLLLGAQSCLPVPWVPAVGGVGSVLLSMARMGWKLCHVFRPYTVVALATRYSQMSLDYVPGQGGLKCSYALSPPLHQPLTYRGIRSNHWKSIAQTTRLRN